MVVSLLSLLKQLEESRGGPSILILHLKASSAVSIMKRSSTFQDVMPALWAYSQEVMMVCHDDAGTLGQLRRALCGSQSAPMGSLTRPLSFFSLLDDAFTHAQETFPHDVLELRRLRLRSGAWPLAEGSRQEDLP
jgi:hypothetical protein